MKDLLGFGDGDLPTQISTSSNLLTFRSFNKCQTLQAALKTVWAEQKSKTYSGDEVGFRIH